MTWRAELAAAVGAAIEDLAPVPGGDINEAYRARLADGRVVFVKTHPRPPPGAFAAEARGLDWLRVDGGPRVPRVVAAGERFLALEWLDAGARGADFDAALGRTLATLHRAGAPSFGLAFPSFLAGLPQDNRSEPDERSEAAGGGAGDRPRGIDGVTFWIERRVRPLCERARTAGRMPDVHARLDALRARPDRFGPDEPPARLHGDLWWGNVLAVGGAPAIVDPAVYGGHREVDLAMLALFGGVSRALIAGYQAVWPLADGWRDRVVLWQLYPLATHAVLFGGGYGGQVVAALAALT